MQILRDPAVLHGLPQNVLQRKREKIGAVRAQEFEAPVRIDLENQIRCILGKRTVTILARTQRGERRFEFADVPQ